MTKEFLINMNETNQSKKDERERPLYIIVQKNLTAIRSLKKLDSRGKLEMKDSIQPEVVLCNHDLAIVKYMNESQYSKDKDKLTYIMKAEKV